MTQEQPAPPVEFELKLAFAPEQRPLLLLHPALQAALAAPPEERHEVTTYFDTPDAALAREGFSLRVRQEGEARTQTLKAAGAGGGAALERGEWEWPVEQGTPDLGLLAGTPAGGAVLDRIDGRLGPVAVTTIRRTACLLRLDGPPKEGSATVEAAFDEGSIAAGEASQPVSELELELRDGPPGAVYRLARSLHAAAPVTVVAESKAERARRLRDGAAPAAVRASDPVLVRDGSVADGVRRVVRSCLGQLVANQAAVAAEAPEGVHQTRIALRRLRSALVLFDAQLKRRARKRLDAELRRLGQVLGAARDWDVFCLDTLPAAMRAAPGRVPDEHWAALRAAAEAERRAAQERLRHELAGPALTGLVLALAAESEAEPGVSALLRKAARRPLMEEAPDVLDRLAGKVARRGRKLRQRPEHELHALRKSLKKLRYSIDFLGSLYDRKAVKAYVHHCKELQEGLGTLNDAAVAEALAGRLSGADPVLLAPATDALTRWSRARRADALHHLSAGWREFKAASPFWT